MKGLSLLQMVSISCILFSQSLRAQTMDNTRKIINQYDSLNKFVPKEKLYVHLDKSIYTTQDTIWFKAYLFDESLKFAPKLSGLIYVEMIDNKGDIIKSMSLPTSNGVTWGSLKISEDNPPGDYIFRAYTNWMQNFGEKYFFKKTLRILSLVKKTPVPIEKDNRFFVIKKPTTTFVKNSSVVDIQFLPEGGTFVGGIEQKIAFKAINENGQGIEVAGEIIDSKKNVILQFASNKMGMGYFKLNPKPNEIYTAVLKKPSNLNDKVLPVVLSKGISLQVKNDFLSDSLIIKVDNKLSYSDLYIIGQSRGTLCFVSHVKTNVSSKTIKVGKDIFPTGLSQIILLNDKKQAINERSFFINHKNELKLTLLTDQKIYNTRDSIALNLKVFDFSGKPTTGSFSMAITDDEQVAKDTLNGVNILNYLLLTSDLKGEIENSGKYFSCDNEENHEAVEALVLTQGWASYFNEPSKQQNFKAEKDYTISGKITNALNNPIDKANVSLFGRNKPPLILQTVTNAKGEFLFEDLPVIDSASFVIKALNSRDKKGTLGIELNEFKHPQTLVSTQMNIPNAVETNDTIVNNLVTNQQQLYVNINGANMLNEITIIGKKVVTNSKNINGAGQADFTLTQKNLNNLNKKTLYEILSENLVDFGANSFGIAQSLNFYTSGNRTKFLIDGIYLDNLTGADKNTYLSGKEYISFIRGYLDSYMGEDLAGIEIMSSPKNFALYKNKYIPPNDILQYCFVEITTKNGAGPHLKKEANVYFYKPMDYGDLKTFYSPKYTSNTKNNKTNDFRSTLFWNPNLVTNVDGETSAYFFSSDKKGTYTVFVEGSDMSGNFGVKYLKIHIK